MLILRQHCKLHKVGPIGKVLMKTQRLNEKSGGKSLTEKKRLSALL